MDLKILRNNFWLFKVGLCFWKMEKFDSNGWARLKYRDVNDNEVEARNIEGKVRVIKCRG